MNFLLHRMGNTFNIDQLVTIFDYLEDMVFIIELGEDEVFRFVEANPAYLKATGMQMEVLKNTPVDKILSSQDSATIIANYKNAISKKQTFSCEENVKINNVNKIFETTIIPIILEDKYVCKYILGVSRDISERKKYENVLLEAKNELRAIVQPQQGIIIEVEKHGNKYIYTLCDGPLVKQFNLTSEEVIGKRPQDIFPPDIAEDVIEQYQLCWNSKEKVFYEWSGQTVHNDEFCWLAILSPIIKNEQVTSIIVYAIDILERKKAEESLMKTEKLALIGELAAGVGHELRNPLTSIRGFIKYMRQNKENIKDEFFDVIETELESLNRIAGELMILAKPQATQFKQLDIIELLNEVVFLLEPEAFSYGVRIIKNYHCNNASVYGEKHQIKQVFINLIKNAFDATYDQKFGKVVIECEQVESELIVKISDNGCGIPEELFEKIGEPFYTTKEKGTGLGLMVSYRIIKNHEGSIVCKSEEGKGTSFIMSFPKI